MNAAALARGAARIARRRARWHRPATSRQRGLVLLALLIALMLMSIALAGAMDVWWLERKREQEQQLLFAGDQYRLAILRYYRAGRVLPPSVEELLVDTRFPMALHHLRRPYPDPVTGKNDWTFMLHGDRIYGVYSSSTDATIKRANFPRRYEDFEGIETYNGWRFFYLPPVVRNFITNEVPAAPANPASSLNLMNDTLPRFSSRPRLP
ncbi:type II secretory pathway pseudopilin PulG [Paraburkholderia sp. UCT70]|uniref:type II secretion system protein n=1 Tax=Paraburkholderia sp. UCT70 TaxID=2991068 RepID=UPI003D23FD47